MKNDAWMPLYIGDYLRDTGHLTAAEHGAYLLLLMQAWTRGGSLPADDARLRAMCRMGAKAWQGSRETILAFFVLEGGAYRHKRVSAELERATSTSSSRSMSGALGAAKRWEKARKNNDRPMANAILPEWQNDAQSQPQSHSITSPLSNERGEESPGKPDDAQPPDPLDEVAEGGKPHAVPAKVLWEMAAVWNEVCGGAGLPSCSELSPKRAKAMRARIKERWAKDPVNKWRAYCQAIVSKPFLRGENNRGWRANFEWALRPSSPIEIHEGKYDDGA